MASVPELSGVRHAIVDWYARGHRALPWRGTRDPYAVLVSEVMLQQTQASRVAAPYRHFMARFPAAPALAAASEADVLSEWSGLGYNRRALALRRAAVAVVANGWPATLQGLQELPGVGAYTARAIGSLAFGWPVGAVDTNVRRWLVRRFGLESAPGAATRATIQAVADALAGVSAAGAIRRGANTWTHASMDLGALICTARRPACDACPVAVGCPARGGAGHVPVPRQRVFRGSLRAHRGALLRALAAAPDHALELANAHGAMATHAAAGAFAGRVDPLLVDAAVAELVREGLSHIDGSAIRLGPAPRIAAATIAR
jgi:A/G-specific adenine glycosylase